MRRSPSLPFLALIAASAIALSLTGCSKDPKPAAEAPAAFGAKAPTAAPGSAPSVAPAPTASATSAPQTAQGVGQDVSNNPLYAGPAKPILADQPAAEELINGSAK